MFARAFLMAAVFQWLVLLLQAAPPPDSKLRASLQPFIDQNQISGAVALVVGREGVLALDSLGKADLSTGREMTPDTLFWIASMTKPMTAMAVMMLVEEGKVSIHDPVEKYLPEFKGQKLGDGKPQRSITVKDLLTHTSGLANSNAAQETLAERVAEYARLPLQFEPGSKWSYSNPGINTLGRMVEVVGRLPYEEFMQERLFKPLGMKDTTFWLNKEQASRLAVSYALAKDGKTLEPTVLRFLNGMQPTDKQRPPVPAGGLFSTANDLALFYRMVINGGTLDGRQYLDPKTLSLMTQNHTGDLKVSFTEGMHMGLGFHIVNRPTGVTAMLNKGSFGHGGAYGTQAWIDPVRETGMVLLIQRAGLPNSDGSDIRAAFQQAATKAFGP